MGKGKPTYQQAYNLFTKIKRKRIIEVFQLKHTRNNDVSTVLGLIWKSMSQLERHPYVLAEEAGRVKYQQALVASGSKAAPRVTTGYQLFISSEIKKENRETAEDRPSRDTFGDQSRITAARWRALSKNEKMEWGKRARDAATTSEDIAAGDPVLTVCTADAVERKDPPPHET